MNRSTVEETDSSTNKIQQGFIVISWNVLHMIHEINYVYDASPVIEQYSIKENWSNETSRLNDIIKILNDLLIKNAMTECFICLQEVPGDLLPMLRKMVDAHVGSVLTSKPLIHTHTYSRKPQIRNRQGGFLYSDSNESLVTIHYNPNAVFTEIKSGLENAEKHFLIDDQILWTPCPSDPGKGALTVTTASGLSVINAHVPYDNKAAFSLLKNITWSNNNNPFVFVGDINRNSSALMKILHEIIGDESCFNLLFPITTDKPTRVGLRRDGTREKIWIDFYIVSASLKNLAILPVEVYDNIGDISDHYPILVQFKAM
ncbi:unnamed protein product [Adineta steineri]|uniref:Endonuclease/exonuclease/phosphatase domain-containing protein n=1 Tax=Adineta steineri TaxID=433720 RepID=A0A819LIV9_9BILA|nr:unnamed protein product [Adineta steineri]CAF3962180.1 unnamed protein product [Adineta steineri]